MILNATYDNQPFNYQRTPTPNSIIENQLFSKTCRPSSLASNSMLQDSSSIQQIPTPKASEHFPKMSFTQSIHYNNIQSFVNLKQTVSDIEAGDRRQKPNNLKKSQIKDHFSEIIPDSFMKPQKERKSHQPIFGRTNEIFEEKIGICESKIINPSDAEWEEMVPKEKSDNKIQEKCNEMIEACTSDMFQFLLDEILEELSHNN